MFKFALRNIPRNKKRFFLSAIPVIFSAVIIACTRPRGAAMPDTTAQNVFIKQYKGE